MWRERVREVGWGVAAGAAGTTLLNTVTYLDMAVRGRPASTTPEETVRRAERAAGVTLDPEDAGSARAGNRRSGIGALLGIAAGVGIGAVYGLVRPRIVRAPLLAAGLALGAGANVGGTAPIVAMGVTDPRTWPAESWVSDLVPHLVYGLATATVFEAIYRGRRPVRGWRRLSPRRR